MMKRTVIKREGNITTPEQFRDDMQKIRKEVGGDEVIAHIRMDEVLCRVLVELGYRDGVAIFDKQAKWYE
jgi:hypothetical protein